jgi:hypothetical protein
MSDLAFQDACSLSPRPHHPLGSVRRAYWRRPALPRRARVRPAHPALAALQHITADPDRAAEITRAALVLTQFEHKYIS